MTKPRKRKPKRSDYTLYPETGSHIDAMTRRRKKAKPLPLVNSLELRVAALDAKVAGHGRQLACIIDILSRPPTKQPRRSKR